jgi:hypothetical protein
MHNRQATLPQPATAPSKTPPAAPEISPDLEIWQPQPVDRATRASHTLQAPPPPPADIRRSLSRTALTPQHVLYLQRTIGNTATLRLIHGASTVIQRVADTETLRQSYGVTGHAPHVANDAALRRLPMAELRRLAMSLTTHYGTQNAPALLRIWRAAQSKTSLNENDPEAYDPLDAAWSMSDTWTSDAARFREYRRATAPPPAPPVQPASTNGAVDQAGQSPQNGNSGSGGNAAQPAAAQSQTPQRPSFAPRNVDVSGAAPSITNSSQHGAQVQFGYSHNILPAPRDIGYVRLAGISFGAQFSGTYNNPHMTSRPTQPGLTTERPLAPRNAAQTGSGNPNDQATIGGPGLNVGTGGGQPRTTEVPILSAQYQHVFAQNKAGTLTGSITPQLTLSGQQGGLNMGVGVQVGGQWTGVLSGSVTFNLIQVSNGGRQLDFLATNFQLASAPFGVRYTFADGSYLEGTLTPIAQVTFTPNYARISAELAQRYGVQLSSTVISSAAMEAAVMVGAPLAAGAVYMGMILQAIESGQFTSSTSRTMQDWVYNYCMAYCQTLRGDTPRGGVGANEGIQAAHQTQRYLQTQSFDDAAILAHARGRGIALYGEVWRPVVPELRRRAPAIAEQRFMGDHDRDVFLRVYEASILATAPPSGVAFVERGGYGVLEQH